MIDSQSRLVDLLFASVLQDPPWSDFLEALEDALPCHNATMVMRKPRAGDPGILIAPRGNVEGMAVLQERLFKKSPFLELPVGQVCLFHEMLTPENRLQHAEYIDYLHSFNTSDLIGLDLVDSQSGMKFRFRAGRDSGQPNFGAKERELLSALGPRMQLAFAIYGRLVSQRNQLEVYGESSEKLAIGSFILNETMEILTKNSVVDRLLEQRDGLYEAQGHLYCVSREDERALRNTLQVLAKSPDANQADRTLKIRREGGRHWNMLLRRAGPNIALRENAQTAVMVFIRDADNVPPVSGELLKELFGLTPAESEVASRLVKGLSVDEAAAELGISKYTARAQLASILSKTDTHRQPQLVSVILSTVNALWG